MQTTVSVSVVCVCMSLFLEDFHCVQGSQLALRHWVSIPAKPLARALSYSSSYFLHFIQAGIFPFLALCEAEHVLHQPNGWNSTWAWALAFHGAGQHPLLRLALLLPCSSHCPEFLLLCKKVQERGMCYQEALSCHPGQPRQSPVLQPGCKPRRAPKKKVSLS